MPAKPVPGGCIENLPRCYRQQLKNLVTSSIIKSDVVPGLWPGRPRFSVVGRGFVVSDLHGSGFGAEYFGCCNY